MSPLTRPQAHTARDRSSAGEIRNWPRNGLSALPVFLRRGMSPNGPSATSLDVHCLVAFGGILLQKSKVAGLRIFAKNPKQEAIANLYNLNRASEVAYEFNVRR